uniref:Uncharacterized protein n=1 Tax=Arundo donax TaxID=35708 RepID=A0A0A9HP06_ARUDO
MVLLVFSWACAHMNYPVRSSTRSKLAWTISKSVWDQSY